MDTDRTPCARSRADDLSCPERLVGPADGAGLQLQAAAAVDDVQRVCLRRGGGGCRELRGGVVDGAVGGGGGVGDLDAEQREEVRVLRAGAGELGVGARQLRLEVVDLLLQLAGRRRPPCCPPLEIEKKT